jgi:hypothetical protein
VHDTNFTYAKARGRFDSTRRDMTTPEAALVAASALVLFVASSQSVASLLGRRVPLSGLDQVMVHPWHRASPLRQIGIVFSIGVAIGTQALVLIGLRQEPVNIGWPLLVEVVLAIGWIVWLVATATHPDR